MTLSFPRLFAPLVGACIGLAALSAAAHPGHGDAHAEPWYNQPQEGAAAPSPALQDGETSAPAASEGSVLRPREPGRLKEEAQRPSGADQNLPEAPKSRDLDR